MLESAWVRGKAPVVDACVRHIKRFGVCHVHAQSAWLPAVFALAVGRLAQVSVSFSAHARDIFVGGTMFPAKLRQAGLCIVCTRAGADYLASVATPADRRKIQHVYHGTDLQMFSYNPPTEPNEPPCLLAVGRMVPKKGFDVLLAACALLKRRLAFRCVIVGSGPLHRTLRRHVGALELDDNVVFPGWQSYSAMPRQYRGADVLVVPSVQALDGDRDGLSNVVTESLACGTPVVPPGDPPALAAALERMLREPELRAHVAEQGRALAEDRFDSRSNVKRVRELLVETVELAK
jgi:glycosyltransferase involved in cell wall biosynthesis